METVQKVMEPQQDAILVLAKLASGLEGEKLADAKSSLEGIRKSDKLLRERLFVLQVWRKYDYQTAHKLAAKKAGEYEDPDLTKILEDREKAKEKDKRELQRAREAQRSRSFTPTKRAKMSGPPFVRAVAGQTTGQQATTYGQYRQTGYNNRGGAGGGAGPSKSKADKNCFICGETGHFFKECPTKK